MPGGVFEGRVVLVTGAAGGIGRALVSAALAKGALVAAFDLRANLEEAVGRVSRILPLTGDAGREEDVAAAVRAVHERFGRLDVLVNGAGRAGKGRVEELALADWLSLIDANLTSVFLFCKHAIPLLRAARGVIVSLSSTNGITGGSHLSGPAYAAAKAGIIALTKNLAQDLAADGVRVNAIAPGPVDTPMLDRLSATEREALRASIPLGELGTAADVAALALFLASPEARHITGVTVVLSGGLVMP